VLEFALRDHNISYNLTKLTSIDLGKLVYIKQ